jgi:ABC-type sugar transport system ATPase subunit
MIYLDHAATTPVRREVFEAMEPFYGPRFGNPSSTHRWGREARAALDEIGVNVPRLDVPVARLSGGQRQAIAVARTVHSDADIVLLDEPLAAMGAKEGAMILDLIKRLKEREDVSMVMIAHNYVHVLEVCDRVNLVQDGRIVFDKPSSQTSVEELTELVVDEYRKARRGASNGA